MTMVTESLPGEAACSVATRRCRPRPSFVQTIRIGPFWQAQLDPFAGAFIRPGFRDFAFRAQWTLDSWYAGRVFLDRTACGPQ
jgi:hypothetical protein